MNTGLRIVLGNTPRCFYTNETNQKSKIDLTKSVPLSRETHNSIFSYLRKSQKILRCSALGVETELEEHLVQILCLRRNPLYTDSLKWSVSSWTHSETENALLSGYTSFTYLLLASRVFFQSTQRVSPKTVRSQLFSLSSGISNDFDTQNGWFLNALLLY